MSAPLIQIRGIGKAFGGVQALADVSLEIAPGEVHALCGENGAGKSTLIKVLSGSLLPDTGEVWVRGTRLPQGGVAAAEAAGIAVIHQEPVVFPHLNAADNLFVGAEPRRRGGLLLDRARMRRDAEALLRRLGETVDLQRPVGELPVAQRQMIAIARALSRSCRLLIMDEPTSSLSARETEVLFQVIRQLRAEGVSVLYVSHRLEEVFALADRVTVLRDGRWVDTRATPTIDREELIRLMVGRELAAAEPGADSTTPGEVLLAVEGLTRDGAFAGVSFQVRAGEVVGLGGLVGAGRSEVARALFGIDRPDSGTVKVGGQRLPPGSVPAAIRQGVALVPEDRQHLGLVLPLPVGTNLTLAVLRGLSRFGFPSKRQEAPLIARLMKELDIRAASAAVPAETLSGGNQQKVVLGKWLAASPRVLILDEPTRGVDVGAKAEVHRLIRSLAQQGMATLLISSDLPELLAMSDRILVMRAGRLAGELGRAEATPEKVLALALGQAPAGAAAGKESA
ncbi:MAG: sugar ABC transporter ATP-binding protein [Armatimonadetes bacterium]|nr:sugar ABC transporter ATP-binding protein [Armatimonadota bacterium]